MNLIFWSIILMINFDLVQSVLTDEKELATLSSRILFLFATY